MMVQNQNLKVFWNKIKLLSFTVYLSETVIEIDSDKIPKTTTLELSLLSLLHHNTNLL